MTHQRLTLVAVSIAANVLAGCAVGTAVPSSEVPPTPAVTAASAAPPTATASATASPSPRLIEAEASVDVEEGGALHAGDDALWVVSESGLTQVSPLPLQVVNRVEFDSPKAEQGASAVGFGSVWTTDFDGNVARRFDATTGMLQKEIAVGQSPDHVSIGAGSVWISNHHDGTVTRYDAPAGRVVAMIEVGPKGRGGPAGSSVGEDGRLWVALPLAQQVVGVDAETNEVTTRADLKIYPCGAAYAADRVWATACLDTLPYVASVEPDGSDVVMAKLPDYPGPPLDRGSRVWMSAGGDGFVALDAETLEIVDSLRVETPYTAYVEAYGKVWILAGSRLLSYDEDAFPGE